MVENHDFPFMKYYDRFDLKWGKNFESKKKYSQGKNQHMHKDFNIFTHIGNLSRITSDYKFTFFVVLPRHKN